MEKDDPKVENPIPVYGIESKKNSNSSNDALKTEEAISPDQSLIDQIAVNAYYKFEARGYQPGFEIQDWLEAEAEINNA